MEGKRTERERVADAVAAMAEEHGVPNNFSAGEIALEAGMHQLRAGQIMQGFDPKDALARRLEASGYRIVRYGKREDGRRYFAVEKVEDK